MVPWNSSRAQPRHFIQIKPEDYNPSRVMNHGMQLARSEFGIFLNADATPQGTNWLRPLVEKLQNPTTAAVFGRQIPRPDCQAVFACDYERCFGVNRESARWEHFFSMVSSGLRKDIWARRGFLEKMQYSEDDEYTRWCRAQGYQVVYCPESVVMHSHNYTPQQAYRRSFGEAKALAAVWAGPPEEFNWPRTVLLGWLNDARRDFRFCAGEPATGGNSPCPKNTLAAKIGQAGWFQSRLGILPAEAGSFCGHRAEWHDELKIVNARFTLDGSDALESKLAQICRKVLEAVQALIPSTVLEALVLGGGYGRGQGGVLKTNSGDQPYNDLEFYVFIRGNVLLNERRYRGALQALGGRHSQEANLHIEFKVYSVEKLRRGAISMFTYDLVAAIKLSLAVKEFLQAVNTIWKPEKSHRMKPHACSSTAVPACCWRVSFCAKAC